MTLVDIKDLIGETFTKIERKKRTHPPRLHFEKDKISWEEEIIFFVDDKLKYSMTANMPEDSHKNIVTIDNIKGNFKKLLNSPIIEAKYYPSLRKNFTGYSFYELSTVKGLVVIRWAGITINLHNEDNYPQEVRVFKIKTDPKIGTITC